MVENDHSLSLHLYKTHVHAHKNFPVIYPMDCDNEVVALSYVFALMHALCYILFFVVLRVSFVSLAGACLASFLCNVADEP